MGSTAIGRLIYRSVVALRGEGAVFRRIEEFQRLAALPVDRVAEAQAAKLAAVLNQACAHAPYYRRLTGSPQRVKAGEAWARLADLPLTGKAELQEHWEAMRATNFHGRVTVKVTGGSTGQAVTIVKNREALASEMAASWMGYGWFGIVMGDRAVRLWGSPFTFRRRLRYRAADFAMNRLTFSAFAFSDADLARYWRRCLSFRPAYLYGYVSMVEAFARYIEREGLDATALGLKAVVTTSEVLSDVQRKLISTAFRCPVQNEYGCGEVGPVAYECEQGSLHIMTPNLALEILKDDGTRAGPGESGEIVLTDLNNIAMPLIRYRVGDFGVPGTPCSCGRGFATLERIWGRQYDFVETPDGRRHHGEYFMYLFEDIRRGGVTIDQFQVTQDGARSLSILLVSHANLSPEVQAAVQEQVEHRVPGMTVSVTVVPEIARLTSGKMHVIRNTWRGGGASA